MKIHFRRFWCLFGCFWRFWQECFENSCCNLTETQVCEIFLRSVCSNFNNFPKIDSTVNITIFQTEICCVIQNIIDHQHFSNLLKFQLNVLWCAISHNIYIQTKFYPEPFMSGASVLEVGVGGTPSYYYVYFSLFIPKNYNI